MGLEHLKNPPITQGETQNYCWAASLSWWLKAMWNRKEDMNDIIDIYSEWVNWDDGDGYGALTEKGLYKLVHDQRWHIHYDTKKNDKITFDYMRGILANGPVMVAYYEPKVKGFHMNVIVAGAGLGDIVSGLVVMDPNYESFQIRTLGYYKEYYSSITFMYRAALSPTPTYGYQQSY